MSELGQLIITGITGTTLNSEDRSFLEKENIGGVVLFSHNYENPTQLAELINNIQQTRKEYPLFIAVDQEGGRVQRFKNQFTILPSMFELSRLDSPKLCFEAHHIMAQELSACGVNLNFSPVCDIWSNPENKVIGDRAFGSDAETVSKYVSAAIRGLQTAKIMACAKHFPGHGSTLKDSHYDLPVVKTGLDDLKKSELVPFVKAIKSRVEFVMMAHLIIEAIDQELPCSLSKNSHAILRKDLKFQKVIITDDMEMKAITDHYGLGIATVMAIKAGTDIALYRSSASARLGLEALREAKQKQELKNDEIAQKVKRVNELKKEYLAAYNPIYIPGVAKAFHAAQGAQFLAQITEKISQLKSI
ncbi:MAG: beta-N-acetylhexosaminidase [Bdellovibrio sp.]|nr:beta-N-acetylhexosaminidase [Bdellovibrio sp.]